MQRMLRVEGAKLQGCAVLAQKSIDPAVGAAFFEDPGDGGEVDEVEAVAFFAMPVVGVAEDVGFDVFAGEEDVEEGLGVFEAADGDFFGGGIELAFFVGVVMDEDDGRFFGVGVEGGGEPVELFWAEDAGDFVGDFERVEDEKVGTGGGDEEGVVIFDG